MTTWTNISNPAVAVGGIPSSATVTALRDNPSALAETASGAPVMRAGWHPVDKVSIGDTKDGLIYDFAVNGALSNIVTPDFEDGYEYRLVGSEITPSSSSTINLEIYKQTTGAYTTVLTLGSLDVTPRGFDLEFWTPRLSLKNHMGFGLSYIGTGTAASTIISSYNATAQKLLRARLSFPGLPGVPTTVGGGKVWLLRRRDYTTSP